MEFLATPEFGQLVTNVLVALASLIITAIGTVVTGFIKSRTTKEQWATIQQIVNAAVTAAESAGLAGQVSDKKSAAIQFASAMLASRGIKIDAEALDAAIEAAVLAQFNFWKIEDEIETKATAAAQTRNLRVQALVGDPMDDLG